MTYQEININDDLIVAQETPTQSKGQEFKDLVSGVYRCKIKQAYVRLSKSSNAVGLNLTLDILKDHKGNDYINTLKDITVWYIKGDGSISDYGTGLLGSMLGILGLPKKLGGEAFQDGLADCKEFNKDTGKYSHYDMEATLMPSLAGKEIWILIGLVYDLYNGNQTKNYSINSFYNDNMQSYNEARQGTPPELWSKRLASVQKKEKKTMEETSLSGESAHSQSYSQPTQANATQGYNANNVEVKQEECPF